MATGDVLANISGTVQLALLVEGEVVPVIIGAVKGIKKLVEGQTVTYTIAIQTGQEQLAAAQTNFTNALTLINQERAKAGLPPLTIPGQ